MTPTPPVTTSTLRQQPRRPISATWGDEIREVNPTEARQLMEEGGTLLDVREADEWEEGHAPGAVHIPLSALTGVSAPEGQPLLTICRSGRRCAQACAGLTAAGRDAINVTGGMVAWRDAGLPVLTDEGAPGAIA